MSEAGRKTNFKLSSRDYLLGLSALYTAVAVSMNIFCMKSLSFGTPYILCDAGLLISWIVFLVSNVIVEVWDKKTSVVLISVAAIIAFLIMVIGRLVVFIPTLDEYAEQAHAYALIFSNGPRTIIASVTAFWVGNYINVHIIAEIKAELERRAKDNRIYFFIRAVISTLIGQWVDNVMFMTLAFAPIGLSVYEMAWKDIMSASIYGTFIELFVEAFFVPFITIPLVRHIRKIKNAEEAA